MRIAPYLLVPAALGAPAAGQIANGGFETGDFTGWAYSGNTGSAAVPFELARDTILAGQQAPLSGVWDPAEGSFFGSLWTTDSVGPHEATLSQVFPGPVGGELRFSYFFDYGDAAPHYDWAKAVVSWAGGQEELFAYNTTPLNRLADDVNIDWTPVVFVFPVSGDFTLTFSVGDASGDFESILGIDNIVPGPGALALAGIGAVVLTRRIRR